MWRDAALVAGKDLRIEMRSRVATNQVAPFAVLVLVLFGLALEPDSGLLTKAAPGLFWIAVLFCSLLAVQRSFAVEAADSAQDGLRLSGLDPAGIFLGKAGAVALELAGLGGPARRRRRHPVRHRPAGRRAAARHRGRRHRRPGRLRAPCTAPWRPGSGSARRSCRC